MSEIDFGLQLLSAKFDNEFKEKGLKTAARNYKKSVKSYVKYAIGQDDSITELERQSQFLKVKERIEAFLENFSRERRNFNRNIPADYMQNYLQSTLDYLDDKITQTIPVATEATETDIVPLVQAMSIEDVTQLNPAGRSFSTSLERMPIATIVPKNSVSTAVPVATAVPVPPVSERSSRRSPRNISIRETTVPIGGGAAPEYYLEDEEGEEQ